MRRRWSVPENFKILLFALWAIGWLPTYLVVYALAVPDGLGGDDDIVSPIFFGAWFLGPCLVALAILAPRVGRWMWAQRPRRVYESAPDIRKVYHHD